MWRDSLLVHHFGTMFLSTVVVPHRFTTEIQRTSCDTWDGGIPTLPGQHMAGDICWVKVNQLTHPLDSKMIYTSWCLQHKTHVFEIYLPVIKLCNIAMENPISGDLPSYKTSIYGGIFQLAMFEDTVQRVHQYPSISYDYTIVIPILSLLNHIAIFQPILNPAFHHDSAWFFPYLYGKIHIFQGFSSHLWGQRCKWGLPFRAERRPAWGRVLWSNPLRSSGICRSGPWLPQSSPQDWWCVGLGGLDSLVWVIFL